MEIKAVDEKTGEIKIFSNYSEASESIAGVTTLRTKIRKFADINGTFMGYKWSSDGQPDNSPVDASTAKISQLNPIVSENDEYATVSFTVKPEENPSGISQTISDDIMQQSKRGYEYVDSLTVLNYVSLIFRKKKNGNPKF